MEFPLLEDIRDELARLHRAASLLIEGGPLPVTDIVEVEVGGNKLTIAPLPYEDATFYFIISEGTDNHIALRSSAYTDMEIRLPMPSYLRVGEDSIIRRDDLC